MNDLINEYKINCADWEFMIDSNNPKSAAIESILLAFSRYKEKLNLSTTIMVQKIEKESKKKNKSFFFGTHSILRDLGMNEIANTLRVISELPRNEIKRIK